MSEPILAMHEHHPPQIYGLQSCISWLLINLADGSFFGTLCAIDAKPAQLKRSRTELGVVPTVLHR